MRPFLTVLTILVFIADGAALLQLRNWARRLEQHPDEPLSAREERRAQNLLSRIGILSAALTLLVLILIFL